MSLKKQALSGMMWSSIQTFGNQFINFGVSIILARLLLPAEFGLIGMLGIFMGIGGVLISSGLGASLIRTTDADQGDYYTVFVFIAAEEVSAFFYKSVKYLTPCAVEDLKNKMYLWGLKKYVISSIDQRIGK